MPLEVHSLKVRFAVVLKVAALFAGAVLILVSLGYSYDELSFLAGVKNLQLGDVIVTLAAFSLGLSSIGLIAQLPDSFRARLRSRGPRERRRPVYGFGTMLAVGVGATLGSPLFVLIPLNIEEYGFVCLASLLAATVLSLLMAKLYSDMYSTSKTMGLEAVGGPSFTRLAAGSRSVRYFVSRVSMWVANTALAAYTKIVFLVFDYEYLPKILASLGLDSTTSIIVATSIAAVFVGWTLLNVLFEKKYLHLLGVIQIVLTAALLVILVVHSVGLGFAGSWNLTGILASQGGMGPLQATIINTGYLYLLFFGFQEIQSLERDSTESSSIPLLSRFTKIRLDRTTYFGVAMILSVAIASAVNILYGLAVFSTHPSLTTLQGATIPALLLAQSVLGPGQELLVAAAFLIATVTTFVPAFLAAARHLSALGEDGFMPRSLTNLSWVFTLVAIFLLAIANMDFLVNITDFMVLISLGIISLSSYWLANRMKRRGVGARGLPLLVGGSCFVLGGAVYYAEPTVVAFGTLAVIMAYLVFDVIELGSIGAQVFLSVLGIVCLGALSLIRHQAALSGFMVRLTEATGGDPGSLLVAGLLISSFLLMANVYVDAKVLKRTSLS